MSKLALGGVQFGIDYGIANTKGQVQIEEVQSILNYAKKNGVNILDTASGYGDSEGVLGKVGVDNFQIITKTTSIKQGVNGVVRIFYQSLKNLKQKKAYGLLIHDIGEIEHKQFDTLLIELARLKRQGLVKKIGVSVYNSQQIDYVLDNFSIDLIQLPINILDQRLINDESLVKLKKHNVEIHARSALLQGLLLMSINAIPSWFEPIKDTLKLFHEEAKKQNLTKLQLALGFVQSLTEIDKVVVGVDSLQQLREIIDASSVKVNTAELSNIAINNSIFLNPSNWRV
jgi:aryl-alcohol dehydrogenase-like predicted oxidoreductase